MRPNEVKLTWLGLGLGLLANPNPNPNPNPNLNPNPNQGRAQPAQQGREAAVERGGRAPRHPGLGAARPRAGLLTWREPHESGAGVEKQGLFFLPVGRRPHAERLPGVLC